jgi:hypothetical protein
MPFLLDDQCNPQTGFEIEENARTSCHRPVKHERNLGVEPTPFSFVTAFVIWRRKSSISRQQRNSAKMKVTVSNPGINSAKSAAT